MKFGVITDIHGNAAALQAVLHELDSNSGISHIFCLGDMIGIGPDTNEVLSILFARDDISMLTGNHDEAVLALRRGDPYPLSHAHVREHHQWIAERLDERYINKLAKLPRVIHRTIDGLSVLFIHYHIEHDKLDRPISEDPFSPILQPSLDQLSSLFIDYAADLVCFGHHHPIHHFKSDTTIYLNPGSLGCSTAPTAPYAILTIERGQIEVECRHAVYDNSHFLASYELLQVPDRQFIMQAFHGNQSHTKQ
ncbi:putative phosphoesterase [Paenibacillus cellulosilyticus]|uniref:Putative phosphoesterase n=1 Tax=Paenibacillus cellulosilyticus TaxID=375489 RepID=A0A2V2Z6U3_9BACL|nr:metallophosphoesterase family protein [Paenibacillus cellulosilyticus]PWW06570.1 putative phosphoesterase [Paenibacillus cellulosilyticus]QKS46097.1 metallophosphoesterase family protein [Paenibacillus cellulosilyticus]